MVTLMTSAGQVCGTAEELAQLIRALGSNVPSKAPRMPQEATSGPKATRSPSAAKATPKKREDKFRSQTAIMAVKVLRESPNGLTSKQIAEAIEISPKNIGPVIRGVGMLLKHDGATLEHSAREVDGKQVKIYKIEQHDAPHPEDMDVVNQALDGVSEQVTAEAPKVHRVSKTPISIEEAVQA